MVLRATIAALAAFSLLCTGFAVDCARMCAMARGAKHMDCWLAQRTGMACDTGTLILLILLDMTAAALAIYLWSVSPSRA